MVQDDAINVEHLLLDVGGQILAEEGKLSIPVSRPLPRSHGGVEVVEGETAFRRGGGGHRSRWAAAEGDIRAGGGAGGRCKESQLRVVEARLVLYTINDFPAGNSSQVSFTHMHADMYRGEKRWVLRGGRRKGGEKLASTCSLGVGKGRGEDGELQLP